MKLYLASQGLPDSLRDIFLNLLGPGRRLAFIENAKDMNPPASRLESETRTQLMAAGIVPDPVDLREFYGRTETLGSLLATYPAVWIAGGNTYYLRYAMRESGFDRIIGPLLKAGMLYAGASAGSIVAGPTLEGYGGIDEPEAAPELITGGLGLTDICVLPHWESERYGEALEKVRSVLQNANRRLVLLRDDQALVIQDNRIERHGSGLGPQ